MPWTQLMDMHSGGSLKVPPYQYFFIELPEAEAAQYFERTFGRDPYNETCDTCGPDYCFDEAETLEQITAYERGCAWDKRHDTYIEEWNGHRWSPYLSIEELEQRGDVRIIRSAEIRSETAEAA